MNFAVDAIENCSCLLAVAQDTIACSTRPLSALGEDQVRVKTEVSLVSPGTELHRLQNTHTEKSIFPRAVGYIAAGKIIGVGAAVGDLKPGQRVLLHQNHCAFHNAQAGKVLPVPDGVDPLEATASVVLAIALRGIRGGQVRFGDSVAIFGLGFVGLFAAHLAKLAGAYPVIGVDPIATRRETAKQMGVDIAIDPAAGDVIAAVRQATGGEGARVSIDASGTLRVMPTLPALTADFGRLVVLGGVHGTIPLDLYTHFQKHNLTMVGCGSPYPTDYPFDERRNETILMTMMRAGIVRPRPAITHFVPWRQGPEMYRKLITEKDKVIGVAFDWSE